MNDDDLRALARAVAKLPLVVAGSGLAIGIPALHGLQPDARAAQLPPAGGTRAVVSGSCSAATNAQVAAFLAAGGEGFAIDPLQLAAGRDLAGRGAGLGAAAAGPCAGAGLCHGRAGRGARGAAATGR